MEVERGRLWLDSAVCEVPATKGTMQTIYCQCRKVRRQSSKTTWKTPCASQGAFSSPEDPVTTLVPSQSAGFLHLWQYMVGSFSKGPLHGGYRHVQR